MRGDSCLMSNNHTLSCMLKADTCLLQIFSTIVQPMFNCTKFRTVPLCRSEPFCHISGARHMR